MSDVSPVPYGHGAHLPPGRAVRVDVVAQRAMRTLTECTPA